MHSANYECPPPELVDGVEEYEVKKILDSRQHGQGHKLQYLVKWKGYTDSENQWVTWDVVHAEAEIRKFRNSHPAAETHIKAVRFNPPNTTAFQPLMSHIPLTTNGRTSSGDVNSPIMILSHSPTPGATPWSSIEVSSRSPSPFIPVNPCSTLKEGVDAILIAVWGDRPESPTAGTPEYDYDLSTPLSPPDSLKPLPTPTPPTMPKPHAGGCTP
ncbi:hypothetical protein EI94DRAFT_1583236 [Lactarius quietus]|nr:hypothetical protein EI94DRAFT_1583236 [Lactarius quietus]